MREEIEGRQGRIETIPADELGTKLYEQQRLDKHKSYFSGPYADYSIHSLVTTFQTVARERTPH